MNSYYSPIGLFTNRDLFRQTCSAISSCLISTVPLQHSLGEKSELHVCSSVIFVFTAFVQQTRINDEYFPHQTVKIKISRTPTLISALLSSGKKISSEGLRQEENRNVYILTDGSEIVMSTASYSGASHFFFFASVKRE